MANAPARNALTIIINALEPLDSGERRRTVDAAMTFLGETSQPAAPTREARIATEKNAGLEEYSVAVRKWMGQHEISAQELDQVFHFKGDGSFEIHDVPGKSKREKTLNTYILTGVGKFLTTNDRQFDDHAAREFCERIGCYDPPNHAQYLKAKHPEFSGDKSRGYSLANPALKRGAELVKELPGATR